MLSSKKLHLGETFHAKIIEVVSSQIFVVEIDGNLMRVRNASKNSLRLGDSVQLVVRSLSPTQLQLLPPEKDSGVQAVENSDSNFERFA